jgi:hypothetical protein
VSTTPCKQRRWDHPTKYLVDWVKMQWPECEWRLRDR